MHTRFHVVVKLTMFTRRLHTLQWYAFLQTFTTYLIHCTARPQTIINTAELHIFRSELMPFNNALPEQVNYAQYAGGIKSTEHCVNCMKRKLTNVGCNQAPWNWTTCTPMLRPSAQGFFSYFNTIHYKTVNARLSILQKHASTILLWMTWPLRL